MATAKGNLLVLESRSIASLGGLIGR